MDDIISRLKKLKSKKGKKASPLDDFFEPDEQEIETEGTDITESDLDIKPLGKSGQEKEPAEQPRETAPSAEIPTSGENLAKGIRELSFDDLDETADSNAPPTELQSETIKRHVIELSTEDPEKVKHLKLIVALLEAEQYEAARQEIDNMIVL